MNKVTSTIRRISLSLIALVLFSTTPVFAQASTNTNQSAGQALEIGPPLVNLKGDPGQNVKATISLRDVSQGKLIVSNEINDFTAGGEDGTPKLLLNQTTPGANSIIPWIKALPQFTLVPLQIQQLTVDVNIPKNAAPGGYYGVIRFSGRPPGIDSNGVSLSASIGALVFIRVNGQARESMSVVEFNTTGDNGNKNWLFEALPFNFNERIKNDGNTFEQPTGSVTITDMFGKQVGKQFINEAQGQVLPGTIRKFTQQFNKDVIGNQYLFGKYTADMTMQYGDSNQTLTSTLTFWIIPYRLIAAIIIGLIALGLLIRYALQRYRERILGGSRGRGGGRRR